MNGESVARWRSAHPLALPDSAWARTTRWYVVGSNGALDSERVYRLARVRVCLDEQGAVEKATVRRGEGPFANLVADWTLSLVRRMKFEASSHPGSGTGWYVLPVLLVRR